MFFVQAIEALSESGASYCVVGGLAVSLHGIPRTTYDLDIVVGRSRANLERVDAALKLLGLATTVDVDLVSLSDDSVRERLLAERNLIAVSYGDASDPLRVVDVLISPPVDSVDDLIARARTIAVGRLTVPLVDPADLLAMKRRAGRPQDLADVAHLERLLGITR